MMDETVGPLHLYVCLHRNVKFIYRTQSSYPEACTRPELVKLTDEHVIVTMELTL